MGSYTELRVNGYELLSTKSYVEPVMMTVFNEGDRRALRFRQGTEGASPVRLPDPYDPELWMELGGDDTRVEVAYSASASVVRDRLHVMGFTLADLELAYERSRAHRLEELASDVSDPYLALAGDLEAERELISKLLFQDWLRNVGEILATGISRWEARLKPEVAAQTLSSTQMYLLDTERPIFGFDLGDLRYLLRAMVEVVPPDADVVQDLSEVVSAGYYDAGDRVAEKNRKELSALFGADVPIVVLTEGRTDSEFVSAALEMCLPHLTDYYSFLDFEGVGVAGGAGPLAGTVKSFIAAGIANRVVACVDNDAAATAAIRSLRHLSIPATVRVIQLPWLPLAAGYPTIGPTGSATMDVNGTAGSIELYFGEDVLTKRDGSFTPVLWKGFEHSVGRYQGELDEKARLQDAFRVKLRSSRELGSPQGDWSAMRLVLASLVNAFAPSSPLSIGGR